MNVEAGDAFIFEQRTWHGIGRNWSGTARKTIFIGYAYRWVKPMDYVVMPEGAAGPLQSGPAATARRGERPR